MRYNEYVNVLNKLIFEFAKKIGFDLVGFTDTNLEKENISTLKKWLKKGCPGEMTYMHDKGKTAARADLDKILPGAKSVVVLGMNYYQNQEPRAEGFGRVARYAFGRDYHKIIWKKLGELENFIQKTAEEYLPEFKVQTASYIDTGPILERALAVQAGLGVIGKNSNLITKEFGSWVFLAEIITNLDLCATSQKTSKPSTKAPFSACGKCERCIRACPTKAIIAPGVIDARRCISYLTIENKGEIPEKYARKIAETKRIFGCDICQEVCPHNFSRQKPTTNKDLLKPKIAGDQIELKKILKIKTDKEFLQLFAGSALMRAKKTGLIRNVKAVI